MTAAMHSTSITEGASIGSGTRVWAFAHVMPGATIGIDCNIGDHCFVEGGALIGNGVVIKNGVSVWDGVEIGDAVFVGPNACFTNDLRPRARASQRIVRTRVEQGASIGANATIICGTTIGRSAMVAAGAVVTRDVAAYTLVAGVPARFRTFVCQCGEPLSQDADVICLICDRRYRHAGAGLEELP
ncbi:MAG TPA: acyltransferase [Candidatus Nitrosotalea sp.]|nr:acyltransferase [Candidatus Nitrosotalea sp.]